MGSGRGEEGKGGRGREGDGGGGEGREGEGRGEKRREWIEMLEMRAFGTEEFMLFLIHIPSCQSPSSCPTHLGSRRYSSVFILSFSAARQTIFTSRSMAYVSTRPIKWSAMLLLLLATAICRCVCVCGWVGAGVGGCVGVGVQEIWRRLFIRMLNV